VRAGGAAALALMVGLLFASGIVGWNWNSGRLSADTPAAIDLFGDLHFRPRASNETNMPALDDTKNYTLEFDAVVGETASPLGAVSGLRPSGGQLDVSRSVLESHGVVVGGGDKFRFRVFQDGVGSAQPPPPPGGHYNVSVGLVLPGGFWAWTLSAGFGPVILLAATWAALGIKKRRLHKRPSVPAAGPSPSSAPKPPADQRGAMATRTSAGPADPWVYEPVAPPSARRTVAFPMSLQAVDGVTGNPILGATVEGASGEVALGAPTEGKDGVLYFAALPGSHATVSAPGYKSSHVRLEAHGLQRVSLTPDRVSIVIRVVGERTGAALQGIPVFLQRGEQIVSQQRSDLEGKVRFDIDGTAHGYLVGTAVQREGFEDTVLDARSGTNGNIQLSVGFRFKPAGPDAEALAALRQDSESLVRQCASVDAEMGALVHQAVAPFLAGLHGLPEWGGLLLSSPYSPIAVHRALVREGHNLVASLQTALAEKAIMNKLTSSRRNLAASPRLPMSADAVQILLRASPEQLVQERQRIAATVQRLDEAITKLAAGHDVLLPSTLWQTLAQALQERPKGGADLVARILLLQVLAALVAVLVEDPAWRARMTA
jgi:hypothetical protein